MDKMKRMLDVGLKGGATAILAIVLSEAVFGLIALIAGIVGVMLVNWTTGGICVVATFFLLNVLALPDTPIAVFDALVRRRNAGSKFPIDARIQGKSTSEQAEAGQATAPVNLKSE
ncbi:MAG: hypothetical protein ACR2RV_25700 [Verrucomicrobiales bacterium]